MRILKEKILNRTKIWTYDFTARTFYQGITSLKELYIFLLDRFSRVDSH